MGWYILKLLIILPLIGLMIWATLRLVNKMQGRLGGPDAGRRTVRVIETVAISPTQRLAVIAFHDREILVAHGRGGLTRLGEAPARPQYPEQGGADGHGADMRAAQPSSEGNPSAAGNLSGGVGGFAAQLKDKLAAASAYSARADKRGERP